MRTLKIEKGGRIFIDGEFADISKLENKGEFLSSILILDVELSDDVTVGDIIHFFYDLKGFIKNVYSEEYEVVRALASTVKLPREYKYFRVYKSFKIEEEDGEEFIYMIPEVEMVKAKEGESGIKSLAGLPLVIDESIKLIHEKTNTTIPSKTKITLLDLMSCLFEDLSILLKNSSLLS
jgi:hypothetical protein